MTSFLRLLTTPQIQDIQIHLNHAEQQKKILKCTKIAKCPTSPQSKPQREVGCSPQHDIQLKFDYISISGFSFCILNCKEQSQVQVSSDWDWLTKIGDNVVILLFLRHSFNPGLKDLKTGILKIVKVFNSVSKLTQHLWKRCLITSLKKLSNLSFHGL